MDEYEFPVAVTQNITQESTNKRNNKQHSLLILNTADKTLVYGAAAGQSCDYKNIRWILTYAQEILQVQV